MTPDEKEYVRLIAREAAQEAIQHMTQNGFMPMLREEARKVAAAHVNDHAEGCQVALKLEKRMAWGTVKVMGALLAAGAGGGTVATILDKLMQ